jgi:hypothetical protein
MTSPRTFTLTPAQDEPAFDPADTWIRLPKPKQQEPHTGLTRAFLYSLLKSGAIRSASLKPRGAIRGVRLIHLGSLLAFIKKNVEEVQP